MLPERVTAEQRPHVDAPTTAEVGAPIGLEEFRLDTVSLDLPTAGPHFMVLGDGESGKTNLLRLIAQGLQQRYGPEQAQFAIVDYRRTLLDYLEAPHLVAMAVMPPMLKDCVERLRATLEPRQTSSERLTLDDLRNPRSWEGPPTT
jgi:DNA segregation ATPase FtsK/SpoIIIE, S-DNA-T family